MERQLSRIPFNGANDYVSADPSVPGLSLQNFFFNLFAEFIGCSEHNRVYYSNIAHF